MIKPKKSIRNLKEYNTPKSRNKSDIKLDFNENTIGCSNAIIKEINKLKRQDYATYPQYENLNKNISNYCKVKPEEILATNGSDDAIKLIIDCFVDKKDKAIIIEPTFSMYEFYLTIASAKITKLNYNKNLSFPTQKILSKICKKTKLIILCNPNNPTGTIIKKKDIIKILNKNRNSVVLVDEAYYEFSKQSVSNIINKYPNLIITRTFSKAFGLAGLRAGYIISNKENIKILSKACSPFSVNLIAKIAINTALKYQSETKKYCNDIKKNKTLIQKLLNKVKIKTYPSESNFIVAKFRDSKIILEKLKQRNILVKDLSINKSLNNCLRITIGDNNKTKTLEKALKDIFKPCLIFDMDGVLIDVRNSYRTAIKKTVEFYTKKNISYNEIESYKKIPGFNNDWTLTQAIITSRKIKIRKSIIINKFQEYYLKEKNKIFRGLINNETWMLKKDLLTKLSKKYTLAIVTGRPKIEAEYALKLNKTRTFFDVVIAKEDTIKEKPYPDPIIKAIKILKTENAIYFGDTINDELASKKAKINFVKINNNSKTRNINKTLERYLK
jgi:histidinol-phosphate aminotransferase